MVTSKYPADINIEHMYKTKHKIKLSPLSNSNLGIFILTLEISLYSYNDFTIRKMNLFKINF